MIYEINWDITGNLPMNYIKELDFFNVNNKIEFKEGLNLIVGNNGCGKSTLVNIIKYYFLEQHGNVPEFNTDEYDQLSLISNMTGFPVDMNVVASYGTPTISMNNPVVLKSSKRLSLASVDFALNKGSQGEMTMMEYNRCVSTLYDNNHLYKHPLAILQKCLPKNYECMESILDYYKRNDRQDRISCMILDEPDNSVSISNILKFQRELDQLVKNCSEGMQVIMILHNPILLMHFLVNPKVNFIEMSENYIQDIKNLKRSLIK